jgi:uncharacterized protein YndB with AHSA1/START domain
MAELKIERNLKASPERVFSFITKSEFLVRWWGPEGMSLPDHSLDFTKPGPWHSVMQNDDGQTFKVSGQVTRVDEPNSVSFTWAWHDENDKRGEESHVTLNLRANDDGTTRFVLHHQQLSDQEAAGNHERGWTSSLRKLERLA